MFVKPYDNYQPHIDGLRALAVLAVIAFHYAPSQFQGGFIGVDVFFVISGYLITGILHNSFYKHTFSFTLIKFYQHRIRRIFPAVILVLFFLLVAGWLALFASEYSMLAKHIAGSAGFIENYLLWTETGYFDRDVAQKPLLHFWSLAVEEQFYIFWPFLLCFMMRKNWPLLSSITVIIVLSFGFNVWSVLARQESVAFYWLHTRTWEMMVGAWLVVAQRENIAWLKKYRPWQSWLGLALIATGFVFIKPGAGFPGFWAILPVLGSALLINAGHVGFLNVRLASWKPAVWIGLISFPLYLWHWVFLALASLMFKNRIPGFSWATSKVLMAMASLLLAWLTYRFIERPIRKKGQSGAVAALMILMLAVGLSSALIVGRQGWDDRPYSWANFSPEASVYMSSMDRSPRQGDCFNLNHKGSVFGAALPNTFYCMLGDTEALRTIVVYGDSHSLSMIPALELYGQKYGLRIIYSGIDSCLPFLGVMKDYNKNKACTELAVRMPELAHRKGAEAVMFIQLWSGYVNSSRLKSQTSVEHGTTLVGQAAFEHGLSQTISNYQNMGIRIIFMEDVPSQKISPPIDKIRFDDTLGLEQINRLSITRAEHMAAQANVNSVLEAAAREYPGSVFTINVDDAMCNDLVCPLASYGRFLYYDSEHLSQFGSMQAYTSFSEQLNQILSKSGKHDISFTR